MYFFFPETNSRTLEEVDAIFLDSKGIFDTVASAARMPRGEEAARAIMEKADIHETHLTSAAEVEVAESDAVPKQTSAM